MKKIYLSSCSSALVLAAGLFAATFPAVGQSVLIDINQVNPSAVTFTTSGLTSFATSSVLNTFGVDLVSYFTAAPTVVASAITTPGLTPAGTATPYTTWIPDNQTIASFLDLNLYNTSNPATQTFVAGNPAFNGTATVNLSSLLADLPITGAQGNIYSGNINSPGVLIGKWVVVPEPSVEAQLALGAMVIAGLALVRRVRRVAARQ